MTASNRTGHTCTDCRPGAPCAACRSGLVRDGNRIRVPMLAMDSMQREIAARSNDAIATRQLQAHADHAAAVREHAARCTAERQARERTEATSSQASYERRLSTAWRSPA